MPAQGVAPPAQGSTKRVTPAFRSFVNEAGFPVTAIEASDVQLFSTAIGQLLTKAPIEALDARVDGEVIDLSGLPPLAQVARVLYWQLRLRVEAKPETNQYWWELAHDIQTRQTDHEAEIARQVQKVAEQLGGIRYQPRDAMDHLTAVMDDPHTVAWINAPTITGGYEKFYDTKGRLTWATPAYNVWDVKGGYQALMAWAEQKAGLLLCWEQTEPGKASGDAVYAYHLRAGVYIYILSNQGDRVRDLMGGLKVVPFKGFDAQKLNMPIIAPTHPITPKSTVVTFPLKREQASYYRDLWMHKIAGKSAQTYYGVAIDGQLAGIGAYDPGPITRPADRKGGTGDLLLVFCVGAPEHTLRLSRLITMLALSRPAIAVCINQHLLSLTHKVITVEWTKNHESKGLRGIMTLRKRVKDKDKGFRLMYEANPTDASTSEIVAAWLKKELHWQKTRAAEKAEA